MSENSSDPLTPEELVRRAGPDFLRRWLGSGAHSPVLDEAECGTREAVADRLEVDELTQRRAAKLLRRATSPARAEADVSAEPFITRAEAAALVRMDPRTFDRRIRGRVPDHGLGGAPRFRASEILAYANAAASKPAARGSAPPAGRRLRRTRRVKLRLGAAARIRAATRAMDRFTLAVHRQADSILTLAQAMSAQTKPTPATLETHDPAKPFVQSERGRAILKELDDDD
jgi:hypothetical protein